MSRESFIRSEDKEFEVTFREVRNWDEYSDLDFEADTAPLTEEEAGTAENVNEDNIWDESDYVVNEGHDETIDDAEEEPENESSDEAQVVDTEPSESDTAVEEPASEEVEDETQEVEGEHASVEESAEEPAPEEDEEAPVVEASADENSGDEEEYEDDEDAEGTASSKRGSSKESTVVLPVVEEDFNMGPAWEEEPEGDEADEDEDNLEVGEPAADTEAFGTSLEHLYEAEEKSEDEADKEDAPAPTEALNLAQLVAASNEDNGSIDTFEAISNEDESLNKADLVEEIAPDYSEDSQPHAIPVEPGEYLSFDGIELDAEDGTDGEKETPAHTEENSDEESEDDDSLSLELDYSELEDQDK